MSWMEGCCMSCELRRLTDPFPTPNLLSLSLAHSLTLPLSVPPPPPLFPSLSSHQGSYLTHEASGLDEHGEVQEAFLNGNDASQGKKEYLL